jgi:hypothetical protein
MACFTSASGIAADTGPVTKAFVQYERKARPQATPVFSWQWAVSSLQAMWRYRPFFAITLGCKFSVYKSASFLSKCLLIPYFYTLLKTS